MFAKVIEESRFVIDLSVICQRFVIESSSASMSHFGAGSPCSINASLFSRRRPGTCAAEYGSVRALCGSVRALCGSVRTPFFSGGRCGIGEAFSSICVTLGCPGVPLPPVGETLGAGPHFLMNLGRILEAFGRVRGYVGAPRRPHLAPWGRQEPEI